MKRNILLNGKTVEYELSVKKVKNINLRIRHDGTVSVSASNRVPIGVIESFLISKADVILSALDRFSRITLSAPSFDDGEKALVLGEEYVIDNQTGRKPEALVSERGELVIFTRDGSGDERKKALMALYGDICKKDIFSMCEEAFEDFSGVLKDMPNIRFRKAKRRWGSCHAAKNTIYLNKLLAAVPRECVRYVIYHEFTHLIHFNHSKSFYEELSKRLPEHRKLKKKLAEYSGVTDF